MKHRLLSGWTFQRALYAIIGLMVIANAVMEQQYWGVAFGAYFAAMGIFNFGCAAGGCYTGNYKPKPVQQPTADVTDIDYTEIKNKQ